MRLYRSRGVQFERAEAGQLESPIEMSETAPASLHEMFWSTEKSLSPAKAVEWRRRLENMVETIVRVRGLPPAEARKEAYRGLVVEYLNATHPNTDPIRCAHCGKPEISDATLLPFGWDERHAWLHRACADPWRARRCEVAVAELAALKIEDP
jgi:hypothetical protein